LPRSFAALGLLVMTLLLQLYAASVVVVVVYWTAILTVLMTVIQCDLSTLIRYSVVILVRFGAARHGAFARSGALQTRTRGTAGTVTCLGDPDQRHHSAPSGATCCAASGNG
jgi:hypothetical protein